VRQFGARDAMRFVLLAFGLVAAIGLTSYASSAEKDVPAWKKPAPSTHAFLGDDGGGVNTVTVCDTADGFRDWLKYEHPRGCQSFQHDLPAVIEVVTFDPVEDEEGTVGLPIVKVHIPSRSFVGYLHLLALHPLIPSGTKIHFKRSGNETFQLFSKSTINNDKGIDLGDHVSATVISYDPSKDDDYDMRVKINDGKYVGQEGWILSFGAHGDDGNPIDIFSGAVISDERKN
jgi:hypothetical protein